MNKPDDIAFMCKLLFYNGSLYSAFTLKLNHSEGEWRGQG